MQGEKLVRKRGRRFLMRTVPCTPCVHDLQSRGSPMDSSLTPPGDLSGPLRPKAPYRHRNLHRTERNKRTHQFFIIGCASPRMPLWHARLPQGRLSSFRAGVLVLGWFVCDGHESKSQICCVGHMLHCQKHSKDWKRLSLWSLLCICCACCLYAVLLRVPSR